MKNASLPTPPAPPRSALVIGGGLIGLSVAVNLQQTGIAVTLCEPDANPQGASWGNAGHLAVEQVLPLASPATITGAFNRLYPRGALALPAGEIRTWAPFALRMLRASTPARFAAGTAALSALLAQAMPAWQRLSNRAGAAHLLREDGHFVAWESSVTAAKGRKHWMAANIGTATVRDATPQELSAIATLAPKAHIAGAVRFAGSGQITHLGSMADALRQTFSAAGGNSLSARADGITLEDGRASVTIDGKKHTADLIALCAGAASAELLKPLGIRIPLIAERGYHIQSAHSSWPQDMPPVAFEHRSMIVTRFADGLRAASFVEFARIETPADPGKWAKLRAHADALGLPFDLPGKPWMGARPTLPDYLPAIGRSTRAPNLLYAFGHQHLGLTLAAATGEAITALATGLAPAIDLAPFDPARFGDTT